MAEPPVAQSPRFIARFVSRPPSRGHDSRKHGGLEHGILDPAVPPVRRFKILSIHGAVGMGRTLIATARPVRVSRAATTELKPPIPRSWPISKRGETSATSRARGTRWASHWWLPSQTSERSIALRGRFRATGRSSSAALPPCRFRRAPPGAISEDMSSSVAVPAFISCG